MSLRPTIVATLGAVALLAAPAAHAQGLQVDGYPAGLQVGGGVVTPIGAAGGSSGIGWDVGGTADLEFRPGLAIRAGYLYGRFGAGETVAASETGALPLRGKAQMHLGLVDLVWKHGLREREATLYVFGGPLVAYRRVTITNPSGDGSANLVPVGVCEPQWLQCSPAPLPYHLALGIRRSTDLGASAGAGISVDVGLRARLFAEARVIFVDGPAFRDAAGAKRSSDATYVPVFFGLRFQ